MLLREGGDECSMVKPETCSWEWEQWTHPNVGKEVIIVEKKGKAQKVHVRCGKLPRLKNQIEIDPQRIMGVEWCQQDCRAGDNQHLSLHKINSWTSIPKRNWLWYGSEIQLRICINAVEQKWRINEQKGLRGISLDEMARNREDRGICISYTACAIMVPSGQLCEGLH